MKTRDFSIKGSLKRQRRNQETLLGKMGAMCFNFVEAFGFQAASKGRGLWLRINKGVSAKGVTCLLGDKRQPENKIWLFRLPLLICWFAIFRLPQMKKQLFKRVKELLPMLVFCLSALLVGNQFA